MTTWQVAATEEEYQDALFATTVLTKDSRPVGFIAPHEFNSTLNETNILRQGNTTLYLLLQIIRKQKEIQDKLISVSARVDLIERYIEKGKQAPTEVSLPTDLVDQLTKQIKDLSIGKQQGKGKAKEGAFRVWK
ncbi:hypothetical protein QKP79_gp2 [Aucuba ringspot virus]|uniref:Uncharacterized protein n=1 Tax=Aucuba ringspot virus TaxID=2599303 RepID=A0AAD1LS24_9VIRU|nr:hypothetical protein QKP79_gp2 [Aucuba ringspot virus]BBL52463.1 unnamed protein product [Aucuba ringspot virus]